MNLTEIYEGAGEELAYFMTHVLQDVLPAIYQDEIKYCKAVIDDYETTTDLSKTWSNMKKYFQNEINDNSQVTGDCFIMSYAVLKRLQLEAKNTQNLKSDITKQAPIFNPDIFYLCKSEIKDSQEDHVAICANFKNKNHKSDEGYVLLDIGLFILRALIIRPNKLEESFLGGFHTQQFLTPDSSTIISIRTHQKNSKISFYYPKKGLNMNDCIDLMEKGIKMQKTFKLKKINAKNDTILKMEIKYENSDWICSVVYAYKKYNLTIKADDIIHINPKIKNLDQQILGEIENISLIKFDDLKELLKKLQQCNYINFK